jgi:hypothetical protein
LQARLFVCEAVFFPLFSRSGGKSVELLGNRGTGAEDGLARCLRRFANVGKMTVTDLVRGEYENA